MNSIRRRRIGIGVLKEAEGKLYLQYPAHRIIQPRLRDFVGTNELGQVLPIYPPAHIHIHPTIAGQLGRVDSIGGNTVLGQLHYRPPVRDDKPTESPLFLEHLAQ